MGNAPPQQQQFGKAPPTEAEIKKYIQELNQLKSDYLELQNFEDACQLNEDLDMFQQNIQKCTQEELKHADTCEPDKCDLGRFCVKTLFRILLWRTRQADPAQKVDEKQLPNYVKRTKNVKTHKIIKTLQLKILEHVDKLEDLNQPIPAHSKQPKKKPRPHTRMNLNLQPVAADPPKDRSITME
jgi:hypothetical protein